MNRRPRTTRHVLSWIAVGCVLGGGAALTVVPDSAQAAEPGAFTAAATSAALRVTVTAPRFLVAETLADGGATVSSAGLTPLGGQSYASSLFPGDTAVAQQAAGLLGLPALPEYPAQVSAEHPLEPRAEAAFPGQEMTADAGADAAEGRAAAGGPAATPDSPAPASSLSLTRVEVRPDGSVVARAESAVSGLAFPGDLNIGRVVSTVTVTRQPGVANPVVDSVTTVTGVEVAGTAVEIGPDGLIAPQAAGLPAGSLSALDDLLAQSGTTVRRVAGESLNGGASTDVLEVRTTSVPLPGSPQATVVYRLGGAVATVIGESAGVLAGPSAPGAPGAPAAPEGVGRPGLPALTGSQVVPAAALPPALGATPATSTAATPTAAVLPVLDLPDRLGLLYLVLLLGGVAAFTAASILRRTGVLRPWT